MATLIAFAFAGGTVAVAFADSGWLAALGMTAFFGVLYFLGGVRWMFAPFYIVIRIMDFFLKII